MKLEDCIKRLERYIRSNDTHPRLVNVRNCNDMNILRSHFSVGSTLFKSVEDYAHSDENPSEESLFNDLRNCSGCVFLTGFTTFYKLLGEQKLVEFLVKLVSLTTSNLHIVVLCYQCDKYLNFDDIRYKNWVYSVEGDLDGRTGIKLISKDKKQNKNTVYTVGIQTIASIVEKSAPKILCVKTSKTKSSYPNSLFDILEEESAYSILCDIDPMTVRLNESLGNSEQWEHALDIVKKYKSWTESATRLFGSQYTLENSLSDWNSYDGNKRWLYFVLLKLFGTPNNSYMDSTVKNTNSNTELIKMIYQHILSLPCKDKNFWKYYDERKALIRKIGKMDLETANYCNWVLSKGEDTIYYLTDMSTQEINLIFEELNNNQNKLDKKDVIEILRHIYLNLYYYLQPFDYKNELLNKYFDAYKYQKVINHIYPEFLSLVEEQAGKRDYNVLLPARCEKTESIDVHNTQVYFIDAMGVEYLAFIMEQCKKYNLMAYTTLCHCELPSITSKNKDFVEIFENAGASFAKDANGIKSLDEIKHHGEEEFDYTNNSLPTYIAKELEILEKIIKTISTKLQQNAFEKAVIISDHGASRLSVISNKENKHIMETKGIHSGRCCPKSESDIQPECAVDSGDFWVIANYDRFKGGRKANVEVHGGATLEEVVIPIIEITPLAEKYDFAITTSKIIFSRRQKNARITIFSTSKLGEIGVKILGITDILSVTSTDGHNFYVDIPNLKTTGDYNVDIYLQDNLIKSDLSFHADNKDFKEKKLL